MESSHFLAVSSPCGTLQNIFCDFWFRLPNAQHLLPKICNCAKSPISRLVWQIDPRCLRLPGNFRGWLIQCNHAKCYATDPCYHGNEISARRRDLVAYRLVCLSRCSCKSTLLFLFLYGIEPFFWPSSLHVALYKTLFFDFWFRPPNAQNLLPKICNCAKSPISRLVSQIDRRCLGLLGGFRDGRFNGTMQNIVGPTLVARATKFG